MSFPINMPLVSIEIKQLILNDTEPPAENGYKIILIKDLTWTKLWMKFKIVNV